MANQGDRGRGSEVPETDSELSEAVAALAEEDTKPESRLQVLAKLMKDQADKHGVRQLLNPRAAVQWMTDAVTEAAPHVPIRELDTLRLHHDGLDGEALVERL